jgi:hypothetical protein
MHMHMQTGFFRGEFEASICWKMGCVRSDSYGLCILCMPNASKLAGAGPGVRLSDDSFGRYRSNLVRGANTIPMYSLIIGHSRPSVAGDVATSFRSIFIL